MAHHNLDAFDDDVQTSRLIRQFEAAISEANRASIKAAAGSVDKDRFLRVAVAVSRLRANYLREVLRLGEKGADVQEQPAAMRGLREMREAYEEALAGFGTLRHAVERHYIDIADD